MAFAIPLATAGIGALGSFLGSRKSSQNKGRFKQVPLFTQPQQNYQNQLLGGLGQATPSGLQYLMSLLSPDSEAFGEFEAPIMRQFQEQIIPQLAERFAGLGSGSLNSSGFQNALRMSATDLSERLGAQRGALRQNALSQLLGFGQLGMQPSFDTLYMKGSPSGLQRFGSGLAGAGFGGLSSYLGGL